MALNAYLYNIIISDIIIIIKYKLKLNIMHLNYKNFIINYSKLKLNKISIFDINNNFYGDYNNIITAKFLIKNKKLNKLN